MSVRAVPGSGPGLASQSKGWNLVDLFSPATFGALELDNRVVLAPMTRRRATADGVPTAMGTDIFAEGYVGSPAVGD